MTFFIYISSMYSRGNVRFVFSFKLRFHCTLKGEMRFRLSNSNIHLFNFFIPLFHTFILFLCNVFSVNLSIADAMVSTLNVTFNYVYMLNSDWPFGTLYCKISQFVAILSIAASVFTLMAISIDR